MATEDEGESEYGATAPTEPTEPTTSAVDQLGDTPSPDEMGEALTEIRDLWKQIREEDYADDEVVGDFLRELRVLTDQMNTMDKRMWVKMVHDLEESMAKYYIEHLRANGAPNPGHLRQTRVLKWVNLSTIMAVKSIFKHHRNQTCLYFSEAKGLKRRLQCNRKSPKRA